MFSRSIFGDVLKLLPRDLVRECAERYQADKGSKRFKSWTHLVTMIGAHLSGAQSLRDVENSLHHSLPHHYHLRLAPVGRSTLSDANAKRPAAFFRDVAVGLMARAQGRDQKACQVLSILDSSPINLQGRGLDWADQSRVRHGNQGLKLHLLIKGGLPAYAGLSDYRVNDITYAQHYIQPEAGHLYVFDKGYCDYNWWHAIINANAGFVTRLKKNAAYEVVKNRDPESPDILSDQIICLSTKRQKGKDNRLYNKPLRLIRIPHPGKKTTPFFIVSSILEAPAADIAQAYKARWQIELLFKWIKQNLKIKRFMAQNKNGIAIQIYSALIAYMLLYEFYRHTTIKGMSRLRDMLFYIRNNLFLRPHTLQQQIQKPPDKKQGELWEYPL